MGLLFKLFNKIPKIKTPECAAVILAAGESIRFGGNKLFVKLYDKPVLAHTLLAFQNCELISEIVVVSRSEDIVPIAELCKNWGINKATNIITGGEKRMDSSLAGICEVGKNIEFVAIHDGARPLVTEEVISGVVQAAFEKKAAVPSIPVTDTIKRCENGMITSTLDRSELRAVQTPQVFEKDMIKGALSAAAKGENELTDDCSAFEALKINVFVTEGSSENIKITTPADLYAGEAIYERRLFH